MGFFGSLLHDAVKGFEAVTAPIITPIAAGATLGAEALDGVVQGGLWVGSKIAGLFGSKWNYKFSPMQLVMVGALAGGLVTLVNPLVRNDLLTPALKAEAKLLGATASNATSPPSGMLPAVCGPEVKAPDGNTYNTIAALVPPGQTPTGPYETDPKTGNVIELGLAPVGECQQGAEVVVTPQEIARTAGLVQALAKAQGK